MFFEVAFWEEFGVVDFKHSNFTYFYQLNFWDMIQIKTSTNTWKRVQFGEYLALS